jgi:probable phosphoglycerate mutase
LSGERLRSAGIDALISSPLRRAVQTAEEVLQVLDGGATPWPLKRDARLREVELPGWEGLTISEVKQIFPSEHSIWCSDPCNLRLATADGLPIFPARHLYHRARLLVDGLLSNYTGKSVLLVTHGGTARALITTALGLGLRHFHRIQQSNCGLSRLSFTGRQAVLELMNDTSHLGEPLPKLKEGKTGVRLLLVPAVNGILRGGCQIPGVLERLGLDCVFPINADGRAAAAAIFRRGTEALAQAHDKKNLTSALKGVLSNAGGEKPLKVAVVAPPDSLHRLLHKQLDLRNLEGSLLLRGPSITAIHCPEVGAQPILQALNTFESQASPSGAYV